jgi:hypothetical protein
MSRLLPIAAFVVSLVFGLEAEARKHAARPQRTFLGWSFDGRSLAWREGQGPKAKVMVARVEADGSLGKVGAVKGEPDKALSSRGIFPFTPALVDTVDGDRLFRTSDGTLAVVALRGRVLGLLLKAEVDTDYEPATKRTVAARALVDIVPIESPAGGLVAAFVALEGEQGERFTEILIVRIPERRRGLERGWPEIRRPPEGASALPG